MMIALLLLLLPWCVEWKGGALMPGQSGPDTAAGFAWILCVYECVCGGGGGYRSEAGMVCHSAEGGGRELTSRLAQPASCNDKKHNRR